MKKLNFYEAEDGSVKFDIVKDNNTKEKIFIKPVIKKIKNISFIKEKGNCIYLYKDDLTILENYNNCIENKFMSIW